MSYLCSVIMTSEYIFPRANSVQATIMEMLIIAGVPPPALFVWLSVTSLLVSFHIFIMTTIIHDSIM